MPLDKFLKERIFDPLGMTDTYFFLPKEKASRLATVYMPQEGQPLKPAPVKGTVDSQGQYVTGPRKNFSGGAGLVSTAKDYYHFLQMMANGGEFNGKRILSSRTAHLMTVDHLDNGIEHRPGLGFGLGFEVVLDQGRRGTYGSVGQFGWGGAYGSTLLGRSCRRNDRALFYAGEARLNSQRPITIACTCLSGAGGLSLLRIAHHPDRWRQSDGDLYIVCKAFFLENNLSWLT